MTKIFNARNVKRSSKLGTTDTILKVLTEIYWCKMSGKDYQISTICRNEQLGILNNALVEGLYDWSYLPTRELAEELRQRERNYEKENWGKKKEQTVARDPELEFVGLDEAQHCNDFGILTWNGHRYRLVPID